MIRIITPGAFHSARSSRRGSATCSCAWRSFLRSARSASVVKRPLVALAICVSSSPRMPGSSNSMRGATAVNRRSASSSSSLITKRYSPAVPGTNSPWKVPGWSFTAASTTSSLPSAPRSTTAVTWSSTRRLKSWSSRRAVICVRSPMTYSALSVSSCTRLVLPKRCACDSEEINWPQKRRCASGPGFERQRHVSSVPIQMTWPLP